MDAHPLSHGQRAIWFVQQLAPDSVVYNAQFTARVRSPLHRLHLRRAVQMLSARHELLRASFVAADGEPRQQIHATLPPDLTWRTFDGDDAALRAAARGVVDRPFDLERGPAWRVAVLARGPEDYLLVIVAHHLIVDLAALSQLAEELAVLYTASLQNVAPDLPPVEHRFAEYVAWHDHLLQTTDGARLRAYWSASLAGQPPALQLPTERARPAVQTYEGASVPLTLAAGTRGRVRELARRTEATPFMVLLAAYEALLARYTAQTDFVVGSPVPGRRGDSRFARVIGSFTNMMPLQADLRSDPSFSELLSRTRTVVQGARDHQEYPFTSIIQDLALPRDPSRSPLFQTLFTLQRAPVEALSAFFVRVPVPVELQLSALVLEPFDVSQQEGQLDIAVELVELGGEYYGELKFNTALWSAPTAADAAAAYATLLDAALTSPDRPISALPLLAPARRAEIAALGTGSPSPAAIERGFSTLFAEQAARTPAAIAVRDRDGALRYDELLARSRAIAGALQTRGVKPGDLVAVAARRGCALIAAMLGVLWAGAAYVALDTDHPPARNAEILAQSGAVGVLAHESLLSVWTELSAAAPHRPWTCPIGEAEQHRGPSPTPASDPGALAYVVFTSGSTGTPKGAMVEQRGMVNHLLAKAADLGLGPTDIIAQNAPQSFVIANWQCLSGLLVGAEIHVIEPAAAADPEALLARVAEAGITILQIVPSLLRVVVEALEASPQRRPLSLRWLVPTGEALPADLCRRWLALYPDVPLLNAYGCSECSDDVAHHRITTPADAGEGVAPLGRPVLGTTLFVLDDRGEPVPIGIEGDLWVGGAGVGRGYLGDPERTAAVFTSDPGTEASTARRYRTGDRARWRPGGSLEYLGRTDQQVKVRGVRIELGEIEAVLRAHPALRDAAVIADRVDGDTRLVAFVVPRPGGEVAADAARAFVAERLPSAMVPAHIERIDVLPTNKHGKLDRRALAARAGELRPAAAPAAPAAGEAVEGEITAIWRELLRVPAVGRDDDFFALGGHSLLAVRLLVRLRERFGVQLPLTAIFELSTVTKLAAAVATTKRPPPAAQTSLSWTPAPERLGEPFPLTELQQAYWLGQSSVVDGQMPAVAYLEHDLHDLDIARFERAWERLIARHPMLRAVLRADGRLQVQPHVWIDHQVSQTREGLRFHWDILEDIFPPGLAAAMFATYADLLARLARGEGWDEPAPARLPEEQLASRREANLTEARMPAMPLHGTVMAQAARTPTAMAVIAADQSLTYGELRARALDLADELRSRGARPGQLVALCIERGWQAVVAALATLAAGAAYVPIDPALPDARRAHLLGRSEASLVLTTAAIDRRLSWPEGLVRIHVEAERPAAHGEANGYASAPDDLAYVIFTSGSTGEPKGVMIDHRGAVNTIADINSRFAVGPGDRVIGVSSLGFDLSVYDLFGPLAVGGALVVPAPERQREPGHWSDLMRRCRVTLWNSAPQMLQLLVDHAEQLGERFPDLRLAMMSGDWIPLDLPPRLLAVAPSVRPVSLGGATEASIWSIVYSIDQMDPAWASVPYGRPLLNQRFHVLDRDLMPRPVWVPGELYIGGIGLAQGYWRDPERTRASFITHPATGERLYRTGDLGRYFPDGNIEFLGRADTQVKIQGYRIELGEIEAHLGRHPAVQACAVVARGEARGEKRLVAYVVAGAEPAELQAHLAATLPVYMVPAQIVRLQAMPLSANGKVDRRALPDPAGALGAEASRAATPPRTATEATLATLWSSVLQTPVTDVHSDFFAELGGNSFAAVRLLSRVQSSLGRTVPLDVFLRGPTLAKLAEHLGDISADVGWSPTVLLASGGRGTPLFLIHPIGGSVLCYRDLAANLAPDRPVGGLQARGLIAGQRPWSSIAEMAGVYADAVERAAPSGPLLLGGWSMGGLVALEVTRVLEGRGRQVEELLLLDSAVPGQIPKSPAAALLRWFARDLIRSAGVQGQPLVQLLSNLTGATRVADVLAAARRSGLLEGVTEAELEHLWQVFSAHQSAMERYMPGPVRAAATMIDASEGARAERAAGWTPWTSALRRIVVPGDHYTMLAAAVRRDAVRDALEARWKVAG